jgi:photosynthesis system II assembly factor YCF48-like protein
LTPVPDRDAALDRILHRYALPAEPSVDDTPVSEDCLDPETAAAMADGGLSPSEQASVAEHALTCARCRELIAAIIRTTPEPPVRRAWWQMPSLRWLAPALATGLAVAVWIAVADRHANVTPVAVPTSAPAQPPTATLEKREIPAVLAPQERNEKADAESARQALSELKDDAAMRGGAKEKVRERSKSARTVDQLAAAKPREEALDKKAFAPAPVPQPAAAPPAEASPAPAAPPTPSGVAGAGRGGVAGGQVRPDSARQTEAFGARAAFSDAAETVAVPIPDVTSPDARSRWRISGASVQRSTDNGATWTAQATGTTVRLTAGSSPNPDICWIVGAQGTVLVSVDGRSWQRLKSPDPGLLVSVRATSADAATVTTSDGRTFATTDRGQTWEQKNRF